MGKLTPQNPYVGVSRWNMPVGHLRTRHTVVAGRGGARGGWVGERHHAARSGGIKKTARTGRGVRNISGFHIIRYRFFLLGGSVGAGFLRGVNKTARGGSEKHIRALHSSVAFFYGVGVCGGGSTVWVVLTPPCDRPRGQPHETRGATTYVKR